MIGIIGAAGDLGGRLCVQLVAAGEEILCFDVSRDKSIRFTSGTDLVTRVRAINNRVTWAKDAAEVLQTCAIVHWCAPLDTLDDVTIVPRQTLLVMHDSVMTRSKVAADKLLARFSELDLSIVHFLMNNHATVIIGKGGSVIEQHISGIGMHPERLSVVEHDRLMAHSQAPLAILCKLLLEDLNEYHDKGMLTNSGDALRQALIDRSANWTDNTYHSVLSNPELPALLSGIQDLINRYKV